MVLGPYLYIPQQPTQQANRLANQQLDQVLAVIQSLKLIRSVFWHQHDAYLICDCYLTRTSQTSLTSQTSQTGQSSQLEIYQSSRKWVMDWSSRLGSQLFNTSLLDCAADFNRRYGSGDSANCSSYPSYHNDNPGNQDSAKRVGEGLTTINAGLITAEGQLVITETDITGSGGTANRLMRLKTAWARYFQASSANADCYQRVLAGSAEAAQLEACIKLYQTDPVSEAELRIVSDCHSYLKCYNSALDLNPIIPLMVVDKLLVRDGRVWFGNSYFTETYNFKDGLANGAYQIVNHDFTKHGQCINGRKSAKEYVYDNTSGQLAAIIDHDSHCRIYQRDTQLIEIRILATADRDEHCYRLVKDQARSYQWQINPDGYSLKLVTADKPANRLVTQVQVLLAEQLLTNFNLDYQRHRLIGPARPAAAPLLTRLYYTINWLLSAFILERYW